MGSQPGGITLVPRPLIRANRPGLRRQYIPLERTPIVGLAAFAPSYVPVRLTPTENKVEELRQGTPHIELNPSTGGPPASAGLPGGSNVIIVGVWMMQADEDLVVGQRLREVLQKAISS